MKIINFVKSLLYKYKAECNKVYENIKKLNYEQLGNSLDGLFNNSILYKEILIDFIDNLSTTEFMKYKLKIDKYYKRIGHTYLRYARYINRQMDILLNIEKMETNAIPQNFLSDM